MADYLLHVVDVAFLGRKQIDSLKSDFRFVAEFFRQLRLGHDYRKPDECPDHPEAVMRLLSVVLDDERFNYAAEYFRKLGGRHTMCEYIDRLEARGEEKGVKKGEERLGKLIEILINADHMEEVMIAIRNPSDRKRLYSEYGITG